MNSMSWQAGVFKTPRLTSYFKIRVDEITLVRLSLEKQNRFFDDIKVYFEHYEVSENHCTGTGCRIKNGL